LHANRYQHTSPLIKLKAYIYNYYKHILLAINNVACVEFASGEYEKAKALFEEALALRRSISAQKRSEEPSGRVSEESEEEKGDSCGKDEEDENSFPALQLSLKAQFTGKTADNQAGELKRMVAVLEDQKKLDDMLADSCNNMAACCEVTICCGLVILTCH